MNAIALSCITFVCISGGALFGMFLPGHHLSTDDKDVIRLGTGLIGTIAALVLGLLIASAKNSYDTQSTQVTQMTSNVVLPTICWRSTDRKRTTYAICYGAASLF